MPLLLERPRTILANDIFICRTNRGGALYELV